MLRKWSLHPPQVMVEMPDRVPVQQVLPELGSDVLIGLLVHCHAMVLFLQQAKQPQDV